MESLLRVSVLLEETGGRDVVVVALALEADDDALGLALLMLLAVGLRADAVELAEVPVAELAVAAGFLISAVLPGLDEMTLDLLAAVDMVDLFSSSLGRLRWLEADVAAVAPVAGRRVAVVVVDEVGGRVGGLLNPPAAARPVDAAAAGLDAAEGAAAGRRVEVDVDVVPGRLVAAAGALESPLALAGGSGVPALDMLGVEGSAKAVASTGDDRSTFSLSDMLSSAEVYAGSQSRSIGL